MGFDGFSDLYNFGLMGHIISIIYLFIIFIIHKKFEIRSIVSYIILICYYSFVLLIALSNSGGFILYGFYLIPYFNFLFFIPIIISLVFEIILYITSYIKSKKENKNEEEFHENENKKNTSLEQNICFFIFIIMIAFQLFMGKFAYWWEFNGKYIVDIKKADVLIMNENYSDAIDILMKYDYRDEVKNKIKKLNDSEIKKLYDAKKYEKCIELTNLLIGKVNDVYVSSEYYAKSYLELYNIAKEKKDYAKMSYIKGNMINYKSKNELIEMGFDFDDFDIFTELKYAKKGAIIELGEFYQESPQMSNNKSSVEWYVTDVTDSTISLIAKKILLEVNFNITEFNENNKCIFDDINKEGGFIDEIFSKNVQNILLEDKNGYKISLVRDEELINYLDYVGYRYNCFRDLHTNYIKTPQYVVAINEESLSNGDDEKYYLRFFPDKYQLVYNDIISMNEYQREVKDTEEKLNNYEIFTNNDRKKAKRKIKYVGVMPRIIINKNLLDNAKNVIENEIASAKNDVFNLVSSQIENAKCVTEYDVNTEVKDMDSIKFGKAPLNNDENKYEWIVLEKKDGKALLLSKYILNSYQYFEFFDTNTTKKGECEWEKSDIRRELNEWFYDDSFDKYEKELIIDTNLINNNNKRFGTESGQDTVDKIFILSVDECDKYFFNNSMSYDDKKIENKKLAAKKNRKHKTYWVQDLRKESTKEEWFSGCSKFWLRTQGEMWWTACFVDANGFVNTRGLVVKEPGIGIRPALWVKYK